MGGDGNSGSSSTREKTVELPLLTAYSLLQTKYGWTLDYIKGRWRKICVYSQEPCLWGSCLERTTCSDWDLSLYGLTRPLFLKFVKIASTDDYEREKRLYNVLGLLITGEPVIKDAKTSNSNYIKNKTVNVEAKKKDILYDFPYDIAYPTEKVIRANIKYWKEYEGEPTIDMWDAERADAARGSFGVIARRCAINNLLWVEYKQGNFKDQQSLKNRVKLDHVRVALYPAGAAVCVEPPSIEYWATLKENKSLHRYIKELDKAGYVLEDGVVPLSPELELMVKEVREELKKESETNG